MLKKSMMTLLILLLMNGWTISLGQSPDLRDIAEAKNQDGTWKYPAVRADLETIKGQHVEELFHMEQRAIMAEDRADSLDIGWSLERAIKPEKHWYTSFEFGIFAGAATAILAAWGMGQVSD